MHELTGKGIKWDEKRFHNLFSNLECWRCIHSEIDYFFRKSSELFGSCDYSRVLEKEINVYTLCVFISLKS